MTQEKALKRRLQNMLGRGTQVRVDDSTIRQRLQVKGFDGETFNEVSRFQNYGHTSVAPDGSELILASLGGVRSNAIALCAEHKDVRLKGLKKGDSALYHLEGHFFKLTENGEIHGKATKLTIEVETVEVVATQSITFTTPKASFSDDVEIGANLLTKGKVTGEKGGMFAGVNSEKHNHDYDDNGTTKTTEEPNK